MGMCSWSRSLRLLVAVLVLLGCAAPIIAAERPKPRRTVIDRDLLAELGEGFSTHRTEHFVVYYDTRRRFAFERVQLFERLYRSFWSTFVKCRVALKRPEEPITVILFDAQEDFQNFVSIEGVSNLAGVYLQRSNRVVFFDANSDPEYLAARESVAKISRLLQEADARIRELDSVNERQSLLQEIARARNELAFYVAKLDHLSSAQNVSTTIHEAAHALSFNLNLFSQDSPPPRWFAEGVAMFFETPRGGAWKGAARFNPERFLAFDDARRESRLPSLRRLLTREEPFFRTDEMEATYGTAWAFTFFLYHVREPQFRAIVEKIREGGLSSALAGEPAPGTISDFEDIMGKPIDEVEEEWLAYMVLSARRHRREILKWKASVPERSERPSPGASQ